MKKYLLNKSAFGSAILLLLFSSQISLAQVPELIKDINPADDAGSVSSGVTMGTSLYFISSTYGISNAKIFKTDGTTGNTLLVKDFTNKQYNGFITVSNLVVAGTTIFFKIDYNPATGSGLSISHQLWKTDGTDAGTTLVKDFMLYNFMNGYFSYCALGNLLLFDASDAANGYELWKSDGTSSGTQLVKNIDPTYSSSPSAFLNFNGTVYFQAYTSATGLDLWKTDGTAGGTLLVKDLPYNTAMKKITNGGSKFYFVLYDNSVQQYDVWASDGTGTGTALIKLMSANDRYFLYDIEMCNNNLFFPSVVAGNNTLWKTNGTAAGTVQVYSNNLGQYRNIDDMACLSSKLFFRLYNTAGNKGDLYVSDGTAANTTALTSTLNVSPGMYGAGSQLFFNANATATGNELYKSDGTAAGTVLVKDIIPGSKSGINVLLGNTINNKLVFQADDSVYNREPYVSDGTAAGTVLLKNTQVNGQGSFPSTIKKIGTQLFFAAKTAKLSNKDPWLSNGTTAGTQPLKNLQAENGEPVNFLDIDGTNFFYKSAGNKLYKSNGTAAGTALIGTINSSNSNLLYAGTALYYADNPNANNNDEELYKYQAGVVSLVKDINPGTSNSSTPNEFTLLNGKVYFFADDGINGRELWKTDGTTAGTTLVENINPGSGSSSPGAFGFTEERMINFNNNLYLLRYNGSSCRLYKSTGNTGGLTVLYNWANGSQFIDKFYVFNNQLYFVVITEPYGVTQLWKTDGTAAGTILVKAIGSAGNFGAYSDVKTFSFLTLGNKFYFHYRQILISGTPKVLGFWCSDGTAAGTIAVATYNLPVVDNPPAYDINVAENNAAAISATEVVFSFFDATHGLELWKTDGTIANTKFLYDLNPGVSNASPTSLVSFNNAVYFAATDGLKGEELWKLSPAAVSFNWTGNVSTAWENTGNWSGGILPDAASDVIISNGRPNYPLLSSNVSVRSLRINPGAAMIIKTGFKLTVLR